MKKKVGIILGVLILLFFIVFAGVKAFVENKSLETPVSIVRVKLLDLESKIFSRGIVLSKEAREISSDQIGKLAKVYVSEGDVVKEGQTLAEIDKSDLEYELKSKQIQLEMEQKKLLQQNRDHNTTLFSSMESARIEYEDSLRDFEANKRLYEMGAVSESELNSSESLKIKAYNSYVSLKSEYENQDDIELQRMNMEVVKAEIDRIKNAIDKSILKSPIDGTVTRVDYKELDLVGENDVICVIENLENLKVITQISEFDISYVELGQKVKINCDSIKDIDFEGEVTKIAPIAQKMNVGSSEETAVEVEISVIDKDTRFKPNFTAEIEILTESKKEAFVIPYEAIYFGKDGKRKVFLVNDEVVEIKDLDLGIEGDLLVEADYEGIKVDDMVVLNPSDNVESGEKVMVIEEKDNDNN